MEITITPPIVLRLRRRWWNQKSRSTIKKSCRLNQLKGRELTAILSLSLSARTIAIPLLMEAPLANPMLQSLSEAVIPYFGYARADRKTQGRESIAAKLVANLIMEAGADRVLACDLYSGKSMGYFDILVDHVYCQPVILDYLASKSISSEDLVVVSPDVGGVARARAFFANKLSNAPLAIVDKRRHGHNVAEMIGPSLQAIIYGP